MSLLLWLQCVAHQVVIVFVMVLLPMADCSPSAMNACWISLLALCSDTCHIVTLHYATLAFAVCVCSHLGI